MTGAPSRRPTQGTLAIDCGPRHLLNKPLFRRFSAWEKKYLPRSTSYTHDWRLGGACRRNSCCEGIGTGWMARVGSVGLRWLRSMARTGAPRPGLPRVASGGHEGTTLERRLRHLLSAIDLLIVRWTVCMYYFQESHSWSSRIDYVASRSGTCVECNKAS